MSDFGAKLRPHGVQKERWDQMKLMDKFKTSLEDDMLKNMTGLWLSRLGMVVFWYTVLTEYYCLMAHIVPEYYETFSPMAKYYIKVSITFLMIQICANWLCVHFYDSPNRQTLDNPDFDSVLRNSTKHINGSISLVKRRQDLNDVSWEDEHSDQLQTGLIWGYCSRCDLSKPPRTHHCKVCNRCILKRDHHCFFTNTCIGYYNQRYFLVMNFYIAIGSAIGLYYFTIYLYMKMGAILGIVDFFLPFTVYEYWFGKYPIHIVFMISNFYVLCWAGIMSVGFCVTQAIAISLGKTTHEMYSRTKIKCTSKSDANFRSVFGAFWGINFLFPAVLVFRQDGDGKHWSDIKVYKW